MITLGGQPHRRMTVEERLQREADRHITPEEREERDEKRERHNSRMTKLKRYSLWAVASLTTYLLYERIKPTDAQGWTAVSNFLIGWACGYIFLMTFFLGTVILMGIWHLHEPEELVETKRGARMLLMADTAAATVIAVTVLIHSILEPFIITPKY